MRVPRPGDVSSYRVVDLLVERLSLSGAFPRLRGVVLWGDSAGGQVLARYSLTTHLPTAALRRLRILPSNPSSFPYIDGRGPGLAKTLQPPPRQKIHRTLSAQRRHTVGGSVVIRLGNRIPCFQHPEPVGPRGSVDVAPDCSHSPLLHCNVFSEQCLRLLCET